MKKKKKRLIILIVLVILMIPIGITVSKYVHEFVGNYLMEADHFYFSSDKLGDDEQYAINNWGGVENFTIQFQLNNHKNNLLVSNSDISYTTSVTCSNDITCTINSTSGIIYTTEMTDSLEVSVVPTRSFLPGESVNIEITATSVDPYEKELSATFTMTVGQRGITYEIDDVSYQPYLNFTITNARDQYTVQEAFGDYTVGSIISTDTYLSLSETDKEKCYSALVTLSFNPNYVIIDTTSSVLDYATTTTTTVDGIDYISSLTFSVDAMSSNVIRFYKIDVSQDYTYPDGDTTSIITFQAT